MTLGSYFYHSLYINFFNLENNELAGNFLEASIKNSSFPIPISRIFSYDFSLALAFALVLAYNQVASYTDKRLLRTTKLVLHFFF